MVSQVMTQDDDLLKEVKRHAVEKGGMLTLSEDAVGEILKTEAAERLRTQEQSQKLKNKDRFYEEIMAMWIG